MLTLLTHAGMGDAGAMHDAPLSTLDALHEALGRQHAASGVSGGSGSVGAEATPTAASAAAAANATIMHALHLVQPFDMHAVMHNDSVKPPGYALLQLGVASPVLSSSVGGGVGSAAVDPPPPAFSSHSFASSGALHPNDVTDEKIPGFIRKTFNLVSCPSTAHVVTWSDDGASFVIHQLDAFSGDILPKYFRHRNFSSFVRQLNFYGFHKQSKPGAQPIAFAHDCFRRGEVHRLLHIRRKQADGTGNGAHAASAAAYADGTFPAAAAAAAGIGPNANYRDLFLDLSGQVRELQTNYESLFQIQRKILFLFSRYVQQQQQEAANATAAASVHAQAGTGHRGRHHHGGGAGGFGVHNKAHATHRSSFHSSPRRSLGARSRSASPSGPSRSHTFKRQRLLLTGPTSPSHDDHEEATRDATGDEGETGTTEPATVLPHDPASKPDASRHQLHALQALISALPKQSLSQNALDSLATLVNQAAASAGGTREAEGTSDAAASVSRATDGANGNGADTSAVSRLARAISPRDPLRSLPTVPSPVSRTMPMPPRTDADASIAPRALVGLAHIPPAQVKREGEGLPPSVGAARSAPHTPFTPPEVPSHVTAPSAGATNVMTPTTSTALAAARTPTENAAVTSSPSLAAVAAAMATAAAQPAAAAAAGQLSSLLDTLESVASGGMSAAGAGADPSHGRTTAANRRGPSPHARATPAETSDNPVRSDPLDPSSTSGVTAAEQRRRHTSAMHDLLSDLEHGVSSAPVAHSGVALASDRPSRGRDHTPTTVSDRKEEEEEVDIVDSRQWIVSYPQQNVVRDESRHSRTSAATSAAAHRKRSHPQPAPEQRQVRPAPSRTSSGLTRAATNLLTPKQLARVSQMEQLMARAREHSRMAEEARAQAVAEIDEDDLDDIDEADEAYQPEDERMQYDDEHDAPSHEQQRWHSEHRRAAANAHTKQRYTARPTQTHAHQSDAYANHQPSRYASQHDHRSGHPYHPPQSHSPPQRHAASHERMQSRYAPHHAYDHPPHHSQSQTVQRDYDHAAHRDVHPSHRHAHRQRSPSHSHDLEPHDMQHDMQAQHEQQQRRHSQEMHQRQEQDQTQQRYQFQESSRDAHDANHPESHLQPPHPQEHQQLDSHHHHMHDPLLSSSTSPVAVTSVSQSQYLGSPLSPFAAGATSPPLLSREQQLLNDHQRRFPTLTPMLMLMPPSPLDQAPSTPHQQHEYQQQQAHAQAAAHHQAIVATVEMEHQQRQQQQRNEDFAQSAYS